MSRHHSLADLREEINVELRNVSGNAARFTNAELDVTIRRAANLLQEYFWINETADVDVVAEDTFNYSFDYPISDIYRVAFIDTQSPRVYKFSEDFIEEEGNLIFLKDHNPGKTIRVWYERHPTPYPSDLTLGIAVDDEDLSFGIPGSIDWPSDGYFKIDDEVVHYTSIDRANNTFTVVRGAEDTAPASHGVDAVISFVNRVEKPVFYEGVKDLCIAYLNRMRVIDAAVAEVQGNVTVMNDILENLRAWIRMHRMRSYRVSANRMSTNTPMRGRRRG